jgi:tRNA dimethylallyltransferase
MDLYKTVKSTCKQDGKNLIIIGGTSFYLKSLLQGLSSIPKITKDVQFKVDDILKDVNYAYSYLEKVDPTFIKSIAKNDKYRLEKALLIYEASKITPTEWFKNNPPKPIIENLDIFNIEVSRDILRKRIEKRTQKMLDLGLIDEICY